MVDFAFNYSETRLDNLTSLCHSQMIQRLIMPLLLRFDFRPQCYVDFLTTHSGEIQRIWESPEIPSSQWNDALIEVLGCSDLPAESKQRHLANLQTSLRNSSGLRGTPQQWIRLMIGLIECCMPRSYEEWLHFAHLAFADEEVRADLMKITNAVRLALDSSIEARRVAFDIDRFSDNNPMEAFARSMTWINQFLTYTETAWPSTSEVNAFGESRGWRMEEKNQSQQATLATLLLSDDTYSGKLNCRGNAEHPVAYLLRHKLADRSGGNVLLLEIDRAGDAIGVCVSDQDAGCPVVAQCVPSRDRSGTVLDYERMAVDSFIKTYRDSYSQMDPTQSEIKSHLAGSEISIGHGKLQKILDEKRARKEYSIPPRKRGEERRKKS